MVVGRRPNPRLWVPFQLVCVCVNAIDRRPLEGPSPPVAAGAVSIAFSSTLSCSKRNVASFLINGVKAGKMSGQNIPGCVGKHSPTSSGLTGRKPVAGSQGTIKDDTETEEIPNVLHV